MRITFLGTGTSHGVPPIDCMLDGYSHCPRGVCLKAVSEPLYRRTRASILVQIGDLAVLVDTSQDFRQQVLAQEVQQVDAVLYTHGHADHIYGLPDIRSYCRHQGQAIDIYGSEETLSVIDAAFGYVFQPPAYVGGGIPSLRQRVVQHPMDLNGSTVVPVPLEHGPLQGCLGYRIDNMAYLPDVKAIPASSMDLLQGLDLLIINCLRLRPHGSHLSLQESMAYVERLRPQRCLFTHMTHDIDYAVEEAVLPGWIRFAYDGLVVDL